MERRQELPESRARTGGLSKKRIDDLMKDVLNDDEENKLKDPVKLEQVNRAIPSKKPRG